MEENVLGVILAGGKSSRMGHDKGLIIEAGQTWAEKAFAKLNQLPIEVVVSINEGQKKYYDPLFHNELLVMDRNVIEGPLNGILSVHTIAPDKDLFLLACDVKEISLEILRKIYNAHNTNISEDYDFFLIKNGPHEEPLIGLYKSAFLKKIYLMAEKKVLLKNSLKYVLTFGKGFYIQVENEQTGYLKNFNTPGDIIESIAIQ